MNGISFEMHFAGGTHTELVETRFNQPTLGVSLVSIRGKSGGAYTRCGSFQWTSGVRAVCVAFLRHILARRIEGFPAYFQGGKASLPSSLDYALSKEPAWLGEMFGQTPTGACFGRRLFKITNPNRKRPGPVTIAVNHVLIRAEDVRVTLNGQRVESTDGIMKILEVLDTDNARVGGSALLAA
jgi:hypothetical protein